jgi:DNA-directed RNA polymerase specialized sigma24 family protein
MSKLALAAFNNLTFKQQAVWLLKMQDNLTEIATARLLGISRDAVHNRLWKAKIRYERYIRRMQRKQSYV